jgi:AbrB family looped-hinge helix DNA binding protein
MPTSTLSTKGQIVVPKEVRDFLELRPGDRVDFVVRDSGEVVLRPAVVDVHQLRGILYRPDRRAVSVAEMNEAIRLRARGVR